MQAEIIGAAVAVVVIFIVLGITFAIRGGRRATSDWLDIEIADWEVYHTARAILRVKGYHEAIVADIFEVASSRLKDRGIKISTEELLDVVTNTLEDLATEPANVETRVLEPPDPMSGKQYSSNYEDTSIDKQAEDFELDNYGENVRRDYEDMEI